MEVKERTRRWDCEIEEEWGEDRREVGREIERSIAAKVGGWLFWALVLREERSALWWRENEGMKKRERGTARETGGRIFYKAKKNKTKQLLHQPRLSIHLCVFVSLLSHVQHTHTKTHGQSVPPSLHLTTQHKTKQVLSPEQPNVNPHSSSLRSPSPGSPQKGSQDSKADWAGSWSRALLAHIAWQGPT